MNFFKRRDFLKSLFFVSAATTLVGSLKEAAVWAADKLDFIDMSEKKRKDAVNKSAVGIAKGLGYVDDANQAKNRSVRKDKAGKDVQPQDQDCANCQFFQANETCQLIPGVKVRKKGWCNTWTSKV